MYESSNSHEMSRNMQWKACLQNALENTPSMRREIRSQRLHTRISSRHLLLLKPAAQMTSLCLTRPIIFPRGPPGVRLGHLVSPATSSGRPLLDRYDRYSTVTTVTPPVSTLCFYALGAFLPSLLGWAHDAHLRIKASPARV